MVPARVVAEKLVRYVEEALEGAGDRPHVTGLLERLWRTGTGADRQQQAFRNGGLRGLRALTESACAITDVAF